MKSFCFLLLASIVFAVNGFSKIRVINAKLFFKTQAPEAILKKKIKTTQVRIIHDQDDKTAFVATTQSSMKLKGFKSIMTKNKYSNWVSSTEYTLNLSHEDLLKFIASELKGKTPRLKSEIIGSYLNLNFYRVSIDLPLVGSDYWLKEEKIKLSTFTKDGKQFSGYLILEFDIKNTNIYSDKKVVEKYKEEIKNLKLVNP